MIEKFSLTIPPLTGTRKKRNAYVYVPDDAVPGERFPVLYMFDGHNVFYDSDATYGRAWRLGDFLKASGTRIIVAAVECSHAKKNGRLSEYSPWDFDDSEYGSFTGRGGLTMRWLTETFKPRIDAAYPTLPDRGHTMIAGSSMGGLMSLFALLKYNAYFCAAAALSPSLWIDPRRLRRMIRTAKIDPDTVLYMDLGDREGDPRDTMDLFAETAALLIKRGIRASCRVVPGGEHCEASWERQLPIMLSVMTYGMRDR